MVEMKKLATGKAEMKKVVIDIVGTKELARKLFVVLILFALPKIATRIVGTKNLVYNLLAVSVILFAFFAFISALMHVSYAATANSIVTANVVVPSVCYLSANSANTINFAPTAPGTMSSYNSILYSDTAGNVNAYLWVASTNWLYSANVAFGFYVSNTVWNTVGSGAGTAMQLWASVANTAILVPAGSSNTVYYAVKIPNAQPANSYTSNIIAQVTC